MAAQHFLAHGAVIGVLDGGDEARDVGVSAFAVDGRDAHKARNIHMVVVCCKAKLVDRDLQGAAVVRHAAANFDDFARVALADGAGVVPDLGFDGAALVGEHGGQKRLAAGRHLGEGGSEQVEALNVDAARHARDGQIVFHSNIPFSARAVARAVLLFFKNLL